MSFWKGDFGKVLVFVIVLVSVLGSVSASRYFSTSNTLSDEIDIIQDNTHLLKIKYVRSEELGGENKEIKVRQWENFQLSLTNNTKSTTVDNVLIRFKFFGISKENIRIQYRESGVWKKTRVEDLRLVSSGEFGSICDVGPEKGWKVEPGEVKNLVFRIKIDKVFENLEIKIRAIRNVEDENEMSGEIVEDPDSKIILNPLSDGYAQEDKPSTNYTNEDHLEITTCENKNAYTLLSFDLSNLPKKIESAKLKLHQYWGSGFSKLKNSGITIETYSIEKNKVLKEITWNRIKSCKDLKKLTEREIKGNNVLYSFEMSDYLNSINKENVLFLIKFSRNNFDNKKRRIRFDSTNKTKPPYLIINY